MFSQCACRWRSSRGCERMVSTRLFTSHHPSPSFQSNSIRFFSTDHFSHQQQQSTTSAKEEQTTTTTEVVEDNDDQSSPQDISESFKNHYTRQLFVEGNEDERVLSSSWNEFLDDRSVNGYLHFKSDFENSVYFTPGNNDIIKAKEILAAKDYQALLENVDLLKRNVASPSVYKLLAFASHQLGDEAKAVADMNMHSMLLVCIESTGDGTKDRPISIIYDTDQKECLKQRALTVKESHLHQIGEGKSAVYLEEVICNEGSTLWFNVTPAIQKVTAQKQETEEAVKQAQQQQETVATPEQQQQESPSDTTSTKA